MGAIQITVTRIESRCTIDAAIHAAPHEEAEVHRPAASLVGQCLPNWGISCLPSSHRSAFRVLLSPSSVGRHRLLRCTPGPLNPGTCPARMEEHWISRKQTSVIAYRMEENRVRKVRAHGGSIAAPVLVGTVEMTERLGGLLKYYGRRAA